MHSCTRFYEALPAIAYVHGRHDFDDLSSSTLGFWCEVPMTGPVPPFVKSVTIYSFELDHRKLRILDYDYFSAGRPASLSMGFTVKQITRTRESVQRCEIRLANAGLASLDDAYKTSTPIDRDTASLSLHDTSVNFKIRDELILSSEQALILALEYTVALAGQGSKLLYSGSVQPSDYSGVRNRLRVDDVSKTIKLVALSRNPFSVRYFIASEPDPYPRSTAGELLTARGLYSASVEFNISFKDWNRAVYFSIAQD
jgi:hypothetical protein